MFCLRVLLLVVCSSLTVSALPVYLEANQLVDQPQLQYGMFSFFQPQLEMVNLIRSMNLFQAALQTFSNNINTFFNNMVTASRTSIQNSAAHQAQRSPVRISGEPNPAATAGHNTVGAGPGDVPRPPTNPERPHIGAEPPHLEHGITSGVNQAVGGNSRIAGNSGSSGSGSGTAAPARATLRVGSKG